MDLPSLTSPEGLYRYFIGLLLLLVAVLALYVLAVALGLLPGPSALPEPEGINAVYWRPGGWPA